jgi:hypothetical protein
MEDRTVAHVTLALRELKKSVGWLEEVLDPNLTDIEIYNRVRLAYNATDSVVGILRDVEEWTETPSPPPFPKVRDS